MARKKKKLPQEKKNRDISQKKMSREDPDRRNDCSVSRGDYSNHSTTINGQYINGPNDGVI